MPAFLHHLSITLGGRYKPLCINTKSGTNRVIFLEIQVHHDKLEYHQNVI